jgi:homoserine dehydrogenase
MLFSEDFSPLPLENWEGNLKASKILKLPLTELLDIFAAAPHQVILVDNTSDQELANAYPEILRKGISIVTPNKKAFSGSYDHWEDIFTAASSSGALVYHESTVGAGLPVISTLKDLVETGDEVIKIEGVFSGTMSFLFNSFCPIGGGGGKFSAEVKKAKELGYTVGDSGHFQIQHLTLSLSQEPDPRDDLNGLDVARKLTILARIAGLPISSPTSFPVQSLIPKPLESAKSGDEFLAGLSKFDDDMETLKKDAAAYGKVLRYVGSIDVATKKVEVKIEKVENTHPIAALKGSDNIISLSTKRYGANPLIVQGSGAGGEVTAMVNFPWYRRRRDMTNQPPLIGSNGRPHQGHPTVARTIMRRFWV